MATLREQKLKLKGIAKKSQRPRYSITDPYEKFWPLLDTEKSKILVNEMEKTITKENGKLKLNWFTLKKLPLDVRKCQIKDLSKKHKLDISPNLKIQRLILKMGINSVSKSIEKDEIACCLIAEDVANSMIAKHLLLMTAAKKIPVLIVPDMLPITKNIIGFSSAVLGLKKNIIDKTEYTLYNLYQTIIQLSKDFKSPYLKQITKRESKTSDNPINYSINVENYLLKKPREGRAFVPGDKSNIRTLDNLSFIPIEKMIVEESKPFDQDEKLIELPLPATSDLFSIDTKPIQNEDVGEYVERNTKSVKEPLRYFGLKIKKMKSNPNRKLKEKRNTNNT